MTFSQNIFSENFVNLIFSNRIVLRSIEVQKSISALDTDDLVHIIKESKWRALRLIRFDRVVDHILCSVIYKSVLRVDCLIIEYSVRAAFFANCTDFLFSLAGHR